GWGGRWWRDCEPDRLYLPAPIEVRVDDLGVCRHDLLHFFGDRAHFHRVGPDHAELRGEADRRAEQETIDPRASFRQRAVGNRALAPGLGPPARRQNPRYEDASGACRVAQ